MTTTLVPTLAVRMDVDVPPPNEEVTALLENALASSEDGEVTYHLREALQQLVVRREAHGLGGDEANAG